MVTTGGWKKPEILDDQFSSFNSRAAANLQRIISETGASIVLTTSHKSSFSISEWENIFKKRGINTFSIKRLENNSNNLSRKDEILNWLNNSNESVGNFVIIDDDKSLNDLPYEIKKKCVITHSLIGLNEDCTIDAINILKNSNNELNIHRERELVHA